LTLLLGIVGFGFCAVLTSTARSGLAWWAGLEVALLVLWVLTMYTGTVEVTPVDVRASGKSFRPTVVPRERVSTMHWTSNVITFRDADHGLLLRIASYGWTGSQVLAIAEALGVPLYNHRTKRGFGKDVKVGKLMTRSPANRLP
jgi:hypothetical protein